MSQLQLLELLQSRFFLANGRDLVLVAARRRPVRGRRLGHQPLACSAALLHAMLPLLLPVCANKLEQLLFASELGNVAVRQRANEQLLRRKAAHPNGFQRARAVDGERFCGRIEVVQSNSQAPGIVAHC